MKFLLNFKRQFATDVESGKKHQTVRATRKDRKIPSVGDIACCYTGLRTRASRLLRESPIISVRRVRICHEFDGQLVVDGELLTHEARTAFARADGFDHWGAMLQFFADNHGRHDFEGFCVEWQP